MEMIRQGHCRSVAATMRKPENETELALLLSNVGADIRLTLPGYEVPPA